MKIQGKIVCDLQKRIGLVRFDRDLGLYMGKLASKSVGIDFAIPRLGCHATFLNGKFDDFKQKDLKAFCKKRKNKKVVVEFDFEKVSCNLSKSGFYGVYATLDEKELDFLRKEVNVSVKKGCRYWSHITFCTTKGIGIKTPKLPWITIK